MEEKSTIHAKGNTMAKPRPIGGSGGRIGTRDLYPLLQNERISFNWVEDTEV